MKEFKGIRKNCLLTEFILLFICLGGCIAVLAIAGGAGDGGITPLFVITLICTVVALISIFTPNIKVSLCAIAAAATFALIGFIAIISKYDYPYACAIFIFQIVAMFFDATRVADLSLESEFLTASAGVIATRIPFEKIDYLYKGLCKSINFKTAAGGMSFVLTTNHDELYDLVLKKRTEKFKVGQLASANEVQYVDPEELPEI